jgi:hypothetical protein
MNDEELLVDLLLDWEERFEQGEDVPAEELCRNCPRLAIALAARIEALKKLAWLERSGGEGTDATSGVPSSAPPPIPSGWRTSSNRTRPEESRRSAHAGRRIERWLPGVTFT